MEQGEAIFQPSLSRNTVNFKDIRHRLYDYFRIEGGCNNRTFPAVRAKIELIITSAKMAGKSKLFCSLRGKPAWVRLARGRLSIERISSKRKM